MIGDDHGIVDAVEIVVGIRPNGTMSALRHAVVAVGRAVPNTIIGIVVAVHLQDQIGGRLIDHSGIGAVIVFLQVGKAIAVGIYIDSKSLLDPILVVLLPLKDVSVIADYRITIHIDF